MTLVAFASTFPTHVSPHPSRALRFPAAPTLLSLERSGSIYNHRLSQSI